MKLALIPPISLLGYTKLTRYQLALPQLMSNAPYKMAYKKHCMDEDQFVILDNGAAEGVQTTAEELIGYATFLKVQEVVIPDVIGDMAATIEAALQFHHDVVPPRDFKPFSFYFMFVAQGQTMIEVLKCADWAMHQDWIDTIGIPRHLITTLGDPLVRTRIVNMLSAKTRAKPMHMLGGNQSNPMEIRELTDPNRTDQSFLRGMDTSLPFNFTIFDRTIDEHEQGNPGVARPQNYFNRMTKEFDVPLLDHNVGALLRYSEVHA